MKLVKPVEVVGRWYWIQRQTLERHGGWEVKPTEEKYFAKMNPQGFPEKTMGWPTIAADEEGLASVLREWGYNLEHCGRSGFESRNFYVVKKNNPTMTTYVASVLVIGALDRDQKEAVGLGRNLSTDDNFMLDLELEYPGEVVADSEIHDIYLKVADARVEWKKRKKDLFAQKFLLKSLDQGITAVMDLGGFEEFTEKEISENFLVLASLRIANTADHRQHLTHTYRYVLLNKDAVKGNSAHVVIPEGLRGIVIGKGGANIKASSAKLGKPIFLKQ
jgi:hypothetical protein